MPKLELDSRELVEWLTNDERNRSVVMLGLEPDIPNSGVLRFDFNWIFDYVPVSNGDSPPRWYIGTSGGELNVRIPDSSTKGYAQGRPRVVNFEKTEARHRTSSFSIGPKVKHKSADSEWEAEAVSFELGAGDRSEFKESYQGEVRVLKAIDLGDGVKWLFHPQSNAILDVAFANFHVWIEVTYSPIGRTVCINTGPRDIKVFNQQHRYLGDVKSALFRFVLWQRAKKNRVRNAGGFDINGVIID